MSPTAPPLSQHYARRAGGQLVAYTVIINGQLYNPSPDLPSRFEPLISH
jgi:hypothetical protein